MLAVVTAVALYGLYSVYALTVVPLIAPPAIPGKTIQVPVDRPGSGPIESIRIAERYLAAPRWPVDAKYKLHDSNAFIYFEEWEPVDSNSAVRFTPFAMVWMQEGREEGAQPTTIVSESAYVRFDSKFDVTEFKIGRIIRGDMEGDVRIDGANGLAIKGKNFVFSENAMHIRSEYPVDFAYERHTGSAKGLQVELLSPENEGDGNTLAVSGVKSVRLRRNVQMNLISDPTDSDEGPVNVEIHSAGSFEYVLADHSATFEDTVHVSRPTGDDQYDVLQCHRLTLQFEEKVTETGELETKGRERSNQPTGVAAASVTNSGSDSAGRKRQSGRLQGRDSELVFRDLKAESVDGKWVMLHSQENDLVARMKQFTYDEPTHVAVLRDQNFVRVHQRLTELRSREITLTHDDEGTISHVDCPGEGTIAHFDETTGQARILAEWSKRLRKYPDPKTGLDVIDLEQQALIQQPQQQTGLASDLIRIWIDPQAKPRSVTSDRAEEDEASRLNVKHLEARGRVALVYPGMQAETKLLQVFFENAPANPVLTQQRDTRRSKGASSGAGNQVTPAQRPSIRPAVALSEASAESEPGTEASTDGPVELVADLIQVRVLQSANVSEMHVDEIWTRGNVHVQQQHEGGEEPLQCDSDRMYLKNRAENDQLLWLYGDQQVAHIRDRGMHIEGSQLNLDRGANMARVQGSGRLTLPIDQTPDGRVLETPQKLIVHWNEQMEFDGLQAKFFGRVQADLNDETTRSQMRCQEMEVVLTGRLNFTEQTQRDETEIDHIDCVGDVEFFGDVYAEGKLKEVRRGKFVRFTLNQLNEQATGQGPGWISVWQHRDGNRRSFMPAATVKANRPEKRDQAEWDYMQIKFSGKMQGYRNRQASTFHDDVEVLYGPVERRLETIDRDDLPEQAGWMGCDLLEVVQREETKGGKGHVELKATTNAQIEGRTFSGQADQIIYDGSKDLYILRADGSRVATIWRQTQVGGDYEGGTDAKQMEYIPSLDQLKVSKATGFYGIE